jgi:hypothetical protein
MPSQVGDPTRVQRAEMETFVLGYPCLIGQHSQCGARLIVDRNASPDDWQDCRCACHKDRVRREGPAASVPAIMRRPMAPPRYLMPPKKHERGQW